MCKELEKELKLGNKAERYLAIHLANMGAGKVENDIEIEDGFGNTLIYTITAELKEVKENKELADRLAKSLKSYNDGDFIKLDSSEGKQFLEQLSRN